MSIQDEIARTESEIANLKAQIATKRAHIERLYLKQNGLEPGDRIIVRQRTREVEAEVYGWEHGKYGTIRAHLVKKDGSISTVNVDVYGDNWRKKEPGE